METKSEGFLCHRDYRTTVPFMRIFFALLFSVLFLLNIYPGSKFFLPIALLVLLWSIWQWRQARASWSLEGTRLCNTLMGKTRSIDLAEGCLVSRVNIQCIHVKKNMGYVQLHFYVFSHLPSSFRFGITGYGGPSAIRRMIENSLFLLPANEETSRLVAQRYPNRTIPEFPAYIGPDTV